MYTSDKFRRELDFLFEMDIPADKDFKILQLTDLHLGFGPLSVKKDKMALHAVDEIIRRTHPDLIVLTGDSVFPYLPKAGTLDNERQARTLTRFLDRYRIPYAFIMGNHDTELGSRLGREELGRVYSEGRYAVFAEGPGDIFGVGNYFINLRRKGELFASLALLDSNMYGDGWFYGGFDCIHEDQADWCMKELDRFKEEKPDLKAYAFFHMPLKEFKEAYEYMKLGDESVKYHFGSIGEKNDYFGISRFEGCFFDKALANGTIKAMFCGHDHLNTLSLTYKGIQMTYGMSIDCLGYKNIDKSYIQRGGTLLTLCGNGSYRVVPVPLTRVVTGRIRGLKETYD